MNEKKQEVLMLIRCCLCIGGAMGLVFNCIGIYFTPISSALNIGKGAVALMVTLMSLGAGFFAPMFVKLNKKFSLKQLMTFGAVSASLMYFIMSFAANIYVFYVCGAILGISSCMFASMPVSITLRDWYGERNASKLGIAFAFTGVVGAVMNPILSKVIMNFGYQMGFRVMGLFELLICVPAAWGIHLKNAPVQTSETIEKKREAKTSNAIPKAIMGMLLVAAVCFSCSNGINSHISSLVVNAGYTLEFSAAVVSVEMIVNTSLKFLYGILTQKVGVFKSITLYLSCSLLGMLGLAFGQGTPMLLFISAGLYSAGFSISTVGSSLLAQRAAKENFPEVYSKMTVTASVMAAMNTTVLGLMADATGGYRLSIFTVLAFAAIGVTMTNILKKRIA